MCVLGGVVVPQVLFYLCNMLKYLSIQEDASQMTMAAIFNLVLSLICFAQYSRLILAQEQGASIQPEFIQAIDSDYLFLDVRPSTLPIDEVGLGVFSKFDIPVNEILCEYRGPIIPESTNYRNDKKFGVDFNGEKLSIVGEGLCSKVNDCVNIINYNYTKAELELILANPDKVKLPLYSGFKYNAAALRSKMGKIYVVSTDFIPADSEIFFEYGTIYWLPTIQLLVSKRELSKSIIIEPQ